MNEQEFIIAARKKGLPEANILNALELYKKMIRELPDISYEILLENTVKLHNEAKDILEETVAVDG